METRIKLQNIGVCFPWTPRPREEQVIPTLNVLLTSDWWHTFTLSLFLETIINFILNKQHTIQ